MEKQKSLLKLGLEQPSALELSFFMDWLNKANVRQFSGLGLDEEYNPLNFYNPNQDYNLLNAFRSNLSRGYDTTSGEMHFTDKYKFPSHPTFSTESKYYKEGMPAIVPLLENNKWGYLPAGITPEMTDFRFSY